MLSTVEFPACLGQMKREGSQLPVSTIIPQPLADLPRDQLGTGVTWFHVTGHLVGGQVLIRRSGDIALLHNMGVFGTRLRQRPASRKRQCEDEGRGSMNVYSEGEDEEAIVPLKKPRIEFDKKDMVDCLPPPPTPLLASPVPPDDNEPLVLSSFEAFFLVHSVGMLQVFMQDDPKSKPLSQNDLWKRFVEQNASFPYHYAVYLFYRGKGWVPKHGLRVGADFTLYAVGPSFCHAAYSVCVHIVHSDTLSRGHSVTGKPMMKSVMTINRVANKVNKKLVMCYVIVPEILFDAQSPKMIEQLRVKEVLVERFNPEKQM